VSFVWLSPPPPVEDLQIKVGDRVITLKWQPVDRAVDGSILAEEPVYQIYRSLDNDKYDPLEQPVADNSFADVRVENSKMYFYRVRTLRRTGDMLQGGALSDIVSGVPGDLTPPAAVQHLVAVRVPVGIKLAWQAVPDADLAGYRIYRRDQDAQEPDLIGEVESSQNQFIDRQPVAAKRWYYSVSAFDTASPANESSPSMEAFMQQQ
jgi:fibronectin type 3 domain-containing protein